MIGTTRAMTDSTGASASTVCYTAFGEKLEASYHRYGYAGSWGYQSHDFPNGNEIPYLHVGWRYYDPGTGRFLQRDPIGIGAGWSVYEYVESIPTLLVDSLGLDWKKDVTDFVEWVYSPITNNKKRITECVKFGTQVAYVDVHQAAANILTAGYAPDFTANRVYPMSAWAHGISVNTSQICLEVACARYGYVTLKKRIIDTALNIWNRL